MEPNYAYNNMTSTGAAIATTRSLEVPEQLNRLAISQEETHKLLDTLENRLHSAMSPEPPSPPEAAGSPIAVLCELGDNLQSRVTSARTINRRLESILNRLEL